MTQAPDLDQLARRYLDLWQQHLGDLAADGEVADSLAKTIELMSGSAAAFAKMAQQGALQPGENNDGEQPSGTTSTGPAPGHSDDDLDKLTDRIEELERRIAELESSSGGKGKVARGRSKGNKS
jgi:hypothetical protein